MSPVLVDRPEVIGRVLPFTGAPLIKVLTGMRRAGKSGILQLLANRLTDAHGPDRVIHLNFERLALSNLLSAHALADHLDGMMAGPGSYCILLDEVQDVEGWERVVNSLLAEGRADIYVTGSNSRMLSSELATHIAGRYVQFDVQTLSFAEHLHFADSLGPGAGSTSEEFSRYLTRGGFPGLHHGIWDDEQAAKVISDIYASAVVRDVLTRNSIRNADMLGRVATFALDNVGSPFSAASVAKYLKSQGRSLDADTALNYIRALSEAFVLNKVPRYDLHGKRLLAVSEKYYAGDHGLITAILGPSDRHLPGLLENIVWAELRRRGWSVTVGKLGDAEVDFVAERHDERAYVQVTTTFSGSEATRGRELAPLLAIADSFPKYLLSMEPMALPLEAGVRHLRIPDFLLGDDLR